MKLVILEPLGVPVQRLTQRGQEILEDRVEIITYSERAEDEQTLIQRSADADIVMLSNIPYSRVVMEKNQNLKMLSVAFTGVDHIAMDYCQENKIAVANSAGYATTAVAELVFGLLFSLYRNIPACDQAVRQQKTKDGLVGFELAGKTFGIVGLGAIGTVVANLANAFGCRVIGVSHATQTSTGVELFSLEEVLAQSDVLSLHVPLTDNTRGMIGAKQLAMMKPSAVLLNTARGPVVDSAALAAALHAGTIAGAGLDVFDTEPPISADDPLLSAPNTVLTPHVAFATAESMEKRLTIAFENVKQWLDGTPQNLM